MISSLILIIQVLCLSLWIGGSATIVLIVSPELSKHLSREQAVSIAGKVGRRLGTLMLPVLFLLAATILVQLAGMSGAANLKMRLALIFVFGGLLLVVYNRYLISPRIRRAADDITFRRLHNRSVMLLVLNLFLGISVVITFIVPVSL
jgi:putative copper export protein